MSLTVRIPAKINLYVQIGSRRENGYHDITTVFQAISLYDRVTITQKKTTNRITVSVEGIDQHKVPTGDGNLVVKAVKALSRHVTQDLCGHFHLEKAIPTQAGLGGGSADAAAAIIGCNKLWGLRLSEAELLAVAYEVDEDTTFFIRGSMALGIGFGQPPTPILCGNYVWHWVLGIPSQGLATPAVYAKFDELAIGKRFDSLLYESRHKRCLQVPWGSASPHALASELTNDLETPAKEIYPDVEMALRAGEAAGALASLMAGAGSTCAFLAENEAHAKDIATALESDGLFRKVILATGPVEQACFIE